MILLTGAQAEKMVKYCKGDRSLPLTYRVFSWEGTLMVMPLLGLQASKTKEAFREVYCWQTISSLELWAKLLSTHSDKEVGAPLHPRLPITFL